MSRPFCLVCKVSTNESDKIYNIEVNHTKCTKTLLREFLNNLLDYAIKYTTLNVCSSCFQMVNELDVLQNRTEYARKKLLNYFSTDLELQKERYKKEKDIKVEMKDSSNDDDEEDIGDLLDFDDEEKHDSANRVEDDIKYSDGNDNDGFGDHASDDDPILDPDVVFDNDQLQKTEKKTKSEETTKRKKKGLNHECSECKQVFKSKSDLKSHTLSEHGAIKPFICEICGQSYRNKPAFDIHVGMHNGIHPFTCPHCNKTFTQKGSLQRHLNMHTGETPFQCDLCGKRFIHHSSFKVHQMHHSGQKDHKCKICNLALMTGSHLRRHMRVHTGEKRYTCEICGKRFAERYNYAVHQKVHQKNGAFDNKKYADKQESDSVKKSETPELQPHQEYYEQTDFTITPLYPAQPQEPITVTKYSWFNKKGSVVENGLAPSGHTFNKFFDVTNGKRTPYLSNNL